MENFKRFTVWGENAEELEFAADRVDDYMKGKTGNNIIYYQIIGEERPQPFDCGFITDKDLKELQQGFIVTAA